MRLEDVWLRYSRRSPWVLREVNVSLNPGEVAVVSGRNGAGKSTLLGAVAGVLPIGRGTVHNRRSVIGWVPERFPATQPFTTRGYLMGLGRVRGLTPAQARSAVDEWAQRLHLTPFLDTRLAELSKGSAQKVGLTQALLAPPDLLVLDEPWEGLDAQTREVIPQIIGEVTAAGGSVLVSDHRGETVKLPQAARWQVADGAVTVAQPEQESQCIIEIAVPQSTVDSVAARLRADGHHVLAVRPLTRLLRRRDSADTWRR